MPRLCALSLLLVLAAAPAAAQQACLSDAEARSEVQAHKLVSVQHAVNAARERTRGDLLSAHLCRREGGYVYRISILASDGRVDRLLINAANGHFSD